MGPHNFKRGKKKVEKKKKKGKVFIKGTRPYGRERGKPTL